MTGSDPQGQGRDIKRQLSPPDSSTDTRATSQKRHVLLLTAAGFVTLLIGSAIVLFLLPSKLPELPQTNRPVPSQAASSSERQATVSLHRPERTEALKAQEEVVSLKIKAESNSTSFIRL